MASKDRFEVKPFLERIQHMPLVAQCDMLTAKRAELELDLASIQQQIADTPANDRLAKPEWWKRIQGARHVKGLQITELTAALGRASSDLRAEGSAASDTHTTSLARCFMMAAEQRLAPADYQELLEQARRLQGRTVRTRQKFVGKLYYADENGILYFMTTFDITATSREAAERTILEMEWDPRLDGASCYPHFEYEAEPDEAEEPSHAAAATENS